jgi:hypothetical protein
VRPRPWRSSRGGRGSEPGLLPKAKRFAVHTLWGVAEERKSAQWVRLALFMAAKYCFPLFGHVPWEVGVWELRCSLAELWYSLRSLARAGDHHGLDLGDGLLGGVWDVRMKVSRADEASNHLERELGVTRVGRGSTLKARIFLWPSPSRGGPSGGGGWGLDVGGFELYGDRDMVRPSRREGVSHEEKKGARGALAKERSMTEGET